MPSLASPYGQMRGFARLQNRTLQKLGYSMLISLAVFIVVVVVAPKDLLLNYVGLGIVVAGLIVTTFANTAIGKRNSSWRPMKAPAQISEITRIQIRLDTMPDDVVYSTRVTFADDLGTYYDVDDELSDDIRVGSQVVGDVNLIERTTRRLKLVS